MSKRLNASNQDRKGPAKRGSGAPAKKTAPAANRTGASKAKTNQRMSQARPTGKANDKQGAAQHPAPRRSTVKEAPEPETGARSKFDLGSRLTEPQVEHIPWGYGQNRITALPVDPRRMYAYWEVRDDAIEVARAALGSGGKDAWLNLRVYDISGRIFDGTNAHSYFDVKVNRDTRQWFLEIGRPTSTHCVEIGLKSYEGYFQKIARSGRVDFPRAEPAPPGPIEWMSVHDVTGEIGPTVPGVPHLAPAHHAAPGHDTPTPLGAWAEGDYWVVDGGALLEQAFLGGWESHDLLLTEWIAGHGRLEWFGEHGRREWRAGGLRFEWVGPVVSNSWEAGPFPTPVELPDLVEERHEGPVLVQRLGERTRVIYGPWQVVIRGFGAHGERQVIARWEVRKSWLTQLGFEVDGASLRWIATAGKGLRAGASEGLLLGASERGFLAGSELRLAGASEVFRIGASEFRFQGASETLFVGGSEVRLRGASERRLGGASERARKGASERRLAGASERARKGASERRLGGASERKVPASARRSGGTRLARDK